MLKKFLLLFVAFTSLLHAEEWLLSGVDPDDSSTYYDFDKVATTTDGVDSWLCWVYSAANILQWWQDKQDDFYIDLYQIPDGNNIDDIYESDIVSTFASVWTNRTGYEFDALTWWLMDTEGVYQSSALSSSLFPDGGGYWSTFFSDVSSICTWTTISGNSDSSAFLNLMSDAIASDSGMSLCIALDGGGHTVTLWGYGEDEYGYYLYLTDSDDTLYGEEGMVKVYISYHDDDTWYLDSYYGVSWSVERITVLDVGSVVFSVPEPSTVTLSLMAFAGLCYRRRRKAVSSEQ